MQFNKKIILFFLSVVVFIPLAHAQSLFGINLGENMLLRFDVFIFFFVTLFIAFPKLPMFEDTDKSLIVALSLALSLFIIGTTPDSVLNLLKGSYLIYGFLFVIALGFALSVENVYFKIVLILLIAVSFGVLFFSIFSVNGSFGLPTAKIDSNSAFFSPWVGLGLFLGFSVGLILLFSYLSHLTEDSDFFDGPITSLLLFGSALLSFYALSWFYAFIKANFFSYQFAGFVSAGDPGTLLMITLYFDYFVFTLFFISFLPIDSDGGGFSGGGGGILRGAGKLFSLAGKGMFYGAKYGGKGLFYGAKYGGKGAYYGGKYAGKGLFHGGKFAGKVVVGGGKYVKQKIPAVFANQLNKRLAAIAQMNFPQLVNEKNQIIGDLKQVIMFFPINFALLRMNLKLLNAINQRLNNLNAINQSPFSPNRSPQNMNFHVNPNGP